MTARERAQRICPIYKATRNADHFAKCGECQRVEREILAAEEDAYLAGYREAKSRWDGTNDGDDYEAFKAWLRSRGEG